MKKISVFLFSIALLASCETISNKKEIKTTQREPNSFAIVIHGGAGDIKREYLNTKQQEAYSDKLKEALNAGYTVLENGGISLDAIQAAINIMEDSPLFNAGKGAVYNSNGNQEMDAAIMNGKTLNSGAIAGVNHIKNPILAARVVMDSSKHVLLSGKGAEIWLKNIVELEMCH